MKTLLLLAGRSRRFWPLSEKSLFPICGHPLIGHQIARLREAGLTDITLVGGNHNLDHIRTLYPDLPAVEQEDLELGMQGALVSAIGLGDTHPILVVSANDVIESEGYAAVVKAAKRRVDGAMLAQRVSHYFPGGYLSTDSDRITGIVEKPGEGNEPSTLVNIVAHVHNDPQALLQALKHTKATHDDGYELALAKLFSDHHYTAVPYEGSWQAVKYGWHLLHLLPVLLKDVKGSIHKTAHVHPTAVIDGQVILDEGVKVLPHATIVGPCYIGRGTVIGTNALVRGSSIGNHCVIGYNTEVKSSVLADHVWTHSTYLGDSVIGNNVAFGGGCMTGNFRLDEGEILSAWHTGEMLPTGLTKFGALIGDDCRIGIQVGMNPGIKIGPGTFVSGGSFLTQDIPENSFARMKEGKVEVSPNKTSAPKPEGRNRYR